MREEGKIRARKLRAAVAAVGIQSAPQQTEPKAARHSGS